MMAGMLPKPDPVPGIYCIVHRTSGKAYIGAAKDIYHRMLVHRQRLNQSRHHNAALQQDWRADGDGAFECSVIQIIESAPARRAAERSLIEAQEAGRLYNHVHTITPSKRQARRKNNKPHCKTAIYLPDEDMAFLKAEAKRRRVSRSKVIQDGLHRLRESGNAKPR